MHERNAKDGVNEDNKFFLKKHKEKHSLLTYHITTRQRNTKPKGKLVVPRTGEKEIIEVPQNYIKNKNMTKLAGA